MSFWDQLVDRLESIGTSVADWAPKIAVAIVVLIVGRWILKIVRRFVRRLLEVPAVKTVFDKSGITGALAPSGQSPAALTATIIYAFLLVVLWLIVAQILELPAIVDLLERLLAVIPLILIAAVVVIIAAAVANWVAALVRPYAADKGVPWLPTATRIIILLIGVLAALDLLDIRFAEDIVKIVVAALAIAFAVAFGIGGIDTAKKWWSKYLTPSQS